MPIVWRLTVPAGGAIRIPALSLMRWVAETYTCLRPSQASDIYLADTEHMNGTRAWTLLALAGMLTACTTPAGIEPKDASAKRSSHVDPSGIVVTLTVSPERVTPPATVVAVLRYENTSADTVNVSSGAGCLSFAAVFSGTTHIPFESTDYACTAAGMAHPVAPGESIGMEWPLPIGGTGVALPRGTYRFVASLNTHQFRLERLFDVR
jgi:hypothetical protein